MHNIYISEWLSLSMFSSNPLAECGLYFIYYLGCGCGGTTIYFKLRGCASAPLGHLTIFINPVERMQAMVSILFYDAL